MNGKVTSVRLEGNQLEIAKMMGQGNMSKGIKNSLELIYMIINERLKLDSIHRVIKRNSGETEAMRKERTRLMNKLAGMDQPKPTQPVKEELMLSDEEIAIALRKEQYRTATHQEKFAMNIGNISLEEAQRVIREKAERDALD